MPNTVRAALALLVIILSFNTAAFAQSHPTVSTPLSASAAENETVRTLTVQYGRALVAGDIDAVRNFWNPQSPNLAAQLRSYKNQFAYARLEFITPEVTGLEITGDKAVSELTVDERRFDNKTGAALLTFDPLRGTCRSFEWIKTSAGWQIQREFLVQDELASRLEAARSDQERDELLEKEKHFVNTALLSALGQRAVRNSTRTEYETALRYAHLQQVVAERLGDPVGVAAVWMNTAIVRNAQDELEAGLEAAHKALALFESLGLKPGIALAEENLSDLYRAMGDHRRAFQFAQKALHHAEEQNNRKAILVALQDLAIIYGQQNNAEQALAHQERAFALAQELGDTLTLAMLRHDMALQYKRFGNHQRALEIYQDLLKQVEAFGDKGGAAMVRDQIGRIFAEQGRYEEALTYHRAALAGLEAANKRNATVITLNNIAAVDLRQRNYTEALSTSQQAVPLARVTERKGDIYVALTNLGYAQLGLNRLEDAQKSFSEAVSIVEVLRRQAAGGVEESQRYFEGGMGAHHGLLSVLVKQNKREDSLFLAERAKARVLLDMLQQGRVSVHKAMTAAEQQEEQRLKSELTRLNKQLTHVDKQDAAAVETQLEKARLNYEAFQNALYAAHPELKTQRGEAPIINAQELAELLPDTSSALLEYVVTDENTYLFVITKPTEKVEIQVYALPIKRAELAKQIESFRQQLAGRDLGFRPSAVKLYDMFLKPAESQLRGKTNVVIAPDSNLWDLPFQALLNANGRFLIEDASISYAPSFTVLREMTKRRLRQTATHGPTTLLAFGNPMSGRPTVPRTGMTLRDGGLDPLPEGAEEVKALARLYGAARSTVYVGADAREDRVTSEAGRASILHFTTHGTLNNAAPMYSYLTLAEGGPNDDGLLEAWELMQLDLKADLAVLSACETARGRIGGGEGVIGLSWAMFIAGVPSTVVSQWKVESASTRDLMVNFHRSLLSSQPTKADALRQAALKLMRNPETSHPFYWAGFVLVGDGG
jgi:CHAT domain-containing protein